MHDPPEIYLEKFSICQNQILVSNFQFLGWMFGLYFAVEFRQIWWSFLASLRVDFDNIIQKYFFGVYAGEKESTFTFIFLTFTRFPWGLKLPITLLGYIICYLWSQTNQPTDRHRDWPLEKSSASVAHGVKNYSKTCQIQVGDQAIKL